MVALALLLTQLDAAHRIDVEFDATPLADALALLRVHTGANLILDAAIAPDHESSPVTLKLRDVPVRTVLKLMLEPRRLTIVQRPGALVVVPRVCERRMVTKVYDVRDLLFPVQSFAGPRMELVEDQGSMPISGIVIFESPRETIPPEVLTRIIPQATGGKDGWTAYDDVGITLVNNMLVVTQSEPVHREVAGLLRLLRQY